jgi:hypothetical protein
MKVTAPIYFKKFLSVFDSTIKPKKTPGPDPKIEFSLTDENWILLKEFLEKNFEMSFTSLGFEIHNP